MRLRRLAAVAAGFVALAFAPTAHATAPESHAGLLIKVDKAQQQMTVSADGERLYTWPVSTGRRGYNTPSGDFTPFRMDRHHRSEEWDDAPMPYSIFFTEQGHAIHGTYEARHLGRAVSHGCVRLSVKNAAILWKLVKEHGKKNTKVVLIGKIPTAAPKVAHAAPKKNDDVTGSVPPRRAQRAERSRRDARWREQRDAERYSYSARERRYEARERRYYPPPPRYYDDRYDRRYDAPPPVFPFFLLGPPRY